MPHQSVQIYSDGGARGNPGPAGIGFVIKENGRTIASGKEYIGEATNNQAEYQAMLAGLRKARQLGAQAVNCYADSELVINQLSHRAKIKNPALGTIFVKIWNMMRHFKKVTFHHIPREQNKEADRLVNQAIDSRK